MSLDTVATAAVFGFLSFAGFEGAASLGEETNDPTRNIPRAIGTAVLVAGEIEGTSFPYDRFPYVVGAWLAVGIAITLVFPALTRSIGASLARSEGLAQEPRGA